VADLTKNAPYIYKYMYILRIYTYIYIKNMILFCFARDDTNVSIIEDISQLLFLNALLLLQNI